MTPMNKVPINIFKRCAEIVVHAIDMVMFKKLKYFPSPQMPNVDEQNVRGTEYEELKLLYI